MTDLEALECIVVDLTPKAKEHNKDEIEQVKKSLEVLEFLKKILYIRGNVIDVITYPNQFEKDVYKKLEDWLDYENIKRFFGKDKAEEIRKLKEKKENDK